jgi:Zn finger protein HypA/HybF involved in hydrogenase expression
MHELALSRAIVDAAMRHADGRPVRVVHVKLGSLRQAVPASLNFYFELVAREAGCDGARLELEPVAARLRCPRCGRDWDPAPPPLTEHGEVPEGTLPVIASFGCPDCGAAGEVLAGGDLEVAWIEVEEPERAGR